MSDNELALLRLLKQRSYKEGEFKLASGDMSTYFIDGKLTEVSSKGAFLIGEAIYEHTKHLSFNAIGGLQVGAVPLTTAAVMSYHHHGREVEGFWIRDEKKAHGTRKLVEGLLNPGDRVIVVDDVCTKGESALRAVQAVRNYGCEVLMVLALVDRQQGARQLFEENNCRFETIFTIEDLRAVDESRQPASTTA